MKFGSVCSARASHQHWTRAKRQRSGYGLTVRRLTTRECERLQGFPDDYTDVTHRRKPAADGPRYKALGNSWAVPVAQWVGRRIEMVEAIPPSVVAA